MTAGPLENPAGEGDPESLGRLIVSLAASHATGALRMQADGATRRLYFYDGVCCSFQSDVKEDALGAVLLRSGWLTPEGLAAIVKRTKKPAPSSGELTMALRPEDLPSGSTLRDALRMQLQLVGAAAFAMPHMTYDYDPFPPDLPTSVGLEVDPIGMMLEGFAALVPIDVVERIVAGLGDGPVLATSLFFEVAPLLADFFTPAVVDQLGRDARPVRDIVASHPSAEAVKRALAALTLLSAVAPASQAFQAQRPAAPRPAAPPSAEPPVEPPAEGVAEPPVNETPLTPTADMPALAEGEPLPTWDAAELARLLGLNFFELLGVAQDASADTVKDAAKKLIAQHHVKAAPSAPADVRDLVVKLGSRIKEAQITLIHPDVRRQYQAGLALPGKPGRPGMGDKTPRYVAEAAEKEAKAFENAGDWEKARAAMTRAIDSAPKEADLHARMGWYTYKCAHIEAAERERLYKYHLEYAIELNPNEPLAHHYLGTIWANQGNKPRARLEFNLALKASPGFTPSKEALEKLDKKGSGPAGPQTQAPADLPKALRRQKNTRAVGMVIVLLALIVPAIIFNVSGGEDRHMEITAEQLGTSLPLKSVAKQGTYLVIQMDEGWDGLSDGDKTNQALGIGRHAGELGMAGVMLFFKGNMAAQFLNGNVTLFKY